MANPNWNLLRTLSQNTLIDVFDHTGLFLSRMPVKVYTSQYTADETYFLNTLESPWQVKLRKPPKKFGR